MVPGDSSESEKPKAGKESSLWEKQEFPAQWHPGICGLWFAAPPSHEGYELEEHREIKANKTLPHAAAPQL